MPPVTSTGVLQENSAIQHNQAGPAHYCIYGEVLMLCGKSPSDRGLLLGSVGGFVSVQWYEERHGRLAARFILCESEGFPRRTIVFCSKA